MDSKALLALADRCEQASGPDYELSMEIYRLRVKYFGFIPNRNDICYPGYHFTASLDAAMTLLPANCCVYQMGEVPDNGPSEKWFVCLWREGDDEALEDANGATAPVALTAAALRALATSEPE